MNSRDDELTKIGTETTGDARETPISHGEGGVSGTETTGEKDVAAELRAETDALCASMEKAYRRAYGDMPSRSDLAELHGFQAGIRDLVNRALSSGAGARDELRRLERECERFKEVASRTKADFLNYQERARRDLDAAEETVLRGYVGELLPILDSMDLALADAQKEGSDPETIHAAVKMLAETLAQTLKVRGLERIEAAGKGFDPAVHEAVSTRPANLEQGERPNQVVEELRPGYLWKRKLLRPCQVLVTAAEDGASANAPDNQGTRATARDVQ